MVSKCRFIAHPTLRSILCIYMYLLTHCEAKKFNKIHGACGMGLSAMCWNCIYFLSGVARGRALGAVAPPPPWLEPSLCQLLCTFLRLQSSFTLFVNQLAKHSMLGNKNGCGQFTCTRPLVPHKLRDYPLALVQCSLLHIVQVRYS